MRNDYEIVELDKSDESVRAMIFSAWIKARRSENDRRRELWEAGRLAERPIGNDVLCAGLHAQVEWLLGRPDTKVVGAVPAGDRDTVLGFAVFATGVLHWISVKKDFRRHGIGSDILARIPRGGALSLTVTHVTTPLQFMAAKAGVRLRLDPYTGFWVGR